MLGLALSMEGLEAPSCPTEQHRWSRMDSTQVAAGPNFTAAAKLSVNILLYLSRNIHMISDPRRLLNPALRLQRLPMQSGVAQIRISLQLKCMLSHNIYSRCRGLRATRCA